MAASAISRVACGTKASITRTAVSASRRRVPSSGCRAGSIHRGSGVFDADPDVLEGHIIVRREMLQRLVGADRLPKLRAVLKIGNRKFEAVLGSAEELCAA